MLRIADLDTSAAMKLVGVTRGTYNSWVSQPAFGELYSKRDELNAEYKQEAIQLLRRDNQLEAVLLEGHILAKMREELNSGEYNLLRSHLAREVYSKLISELDVIPQTQILSWEQRVQQIWNNVPEQLNSGEVVDIEAKEILVIEEGQSQV